MNRLQKKCFIASSGMHLLLAVILLVGPAFLSSKSKLDDFQAIDFVPSMLIDANFAGGGNRNARPQQAVASPPRQAPAPAPQPVPEKSREPDPPKTAAKTPKVDPDSFESKPHRPEINTTLVSRKSTSNTTSKTKTTTRDSQAEEKQVADQRRRLATQIATAARNIRDGAASATDIEYGPGNDNSPAYASYAAFVKSVYENAWEAPEDSATDDAVTKVSVTINSDGTVTSHRITRPSGDSPVDHSVQRTLDRVTFIAPFPDGSKDRQRTYIINFNLKAKRGLA